MLEMIFWILFGCALGVITGLAPGIHSNTVSVIALAYFSGHDANLAAMIVAMSIVHSFVEFVPSILLGSPESDSYLSVLPGHYFFQQGKALFAIKLAITGGLLAAILAVALLPFFFIFVIRLDVFFKEIIPWFLTLSIFALVFSEKDKKFAAATVLLSAALGMASLQGGLSGNSIFPLITGFFGGSTMIYSLQKKEAVVEQEKKTFSLKKMKTLKAVFLSIASAMAVAIFPSMGASQATFLIKQFTGKISKAQYLIIIGGAATANHVFSLAFLFLTQKTRTGTAAAVKELVELKDYSFFLIIFTALIAAGIGAIATEIIALKAIGNIHRINYGLLNKMVFAALAGLSFLFGGAIGTIQFFCATSIGLMAVTSGVKRSACMAFLMVPTILFYLKANQII
ncbi:MAG: tripartite tricarboxylate transporter permease [Candidatus Diapherotrites archaeon]|nr:tripartite tricarboxylate transporter permease [Candidatus Diapherotrites archaeon]